jgi:hypothetical protein
VTTIQAEPSPEPKAIGLGFVEKEWAGFPTRLPEERDGQENPTEGGFSNPPRGTSGGQECPPSAGNAIFNPDGEIDKTQHHLPHWQQGESWVFVTWQLGDSLPKAKLDQWKAEREAWMQHHPEPWDERTEEEYHDRFSRQVDD